MNHSTTEGCRNGSLSEVVEVRDALPAELAEGALRAVVALHAALAPFTARAPAAAPPVDTGWCHYCHAAQALDVEGNVPVHSLPAEQCPAGGTAGVRTLPGGTPPCAQPSLLWDSTYFVEAPSTAASSGSGSVVVLAPTGVTASSVLPGPSAEE